MFGAALGDIIGAPMEFDRGEKTKDFPLFSGQSEFTDDTVMTVAVAEALLRVSPENSDDEIRAALVESLKRWGRKYPDYGYGLRFNHWLLSEKSEPYDSCGNGSAMRCSAAGWLYSSLEETHRMARLSADVTHNHKEGVKAAKAVASAIYLARNGSSQAEIKAYVEKTFEYDLSRTLDAIRPGYHHVELAQESVPEAIIAFLEGVSFEDTIRNAISIGGDTDTVAAIAGSIAEAYFGVPEDLKQECLRRIPEEIAEVLGKIG